MATADSGSENLATSCPEKDSTPYERIVLEPPPNLEKEIEEAKGTEILFFIYSFSTLFNTASSTAPQISLFRRMLGSNLDTVATSALAVRRSNNSARLDLVHNSARSHPQLLVDLIHNSARSHPQLEDLLLLHAPGLCRDSSHPALGNRND
jgi:hypothetical protein